MIKRLYLANGYLLSPLDRTSDDIAVDASIATLLQAKLGMGDHCYLTLVYRDKLEVIKVRKDYSGFRVDRAQDGTCRQGFPTNTTIKYTLTGAEIADSVDIGVWSIYASGYGMATVVGGNGSWAVGLDTIHADTVGGLDARTEGNELVISDKTGMFGCCDGGITGAPFIPGPFFYLTSQLYPQEVVEIMTPQPKDRDGNSIPPINFDLPWWLLTQPSQIEQYIGRGISVFDWQNFGSQGSFTAPPEQYMKTGVGVGIYTEWLKYGGQEAFTAPVEQYIGRDCYPLQMLLFGGEVTYDRALDAYLIPRILLLDWTLS